MLEALENRRYMYAGNFSPLYIYGTSADDTITLSQSGYVLTVVNNGVTSTHSTYYMTGGATPDSGIPSGISKVVVYGYDGDDTIEADETVQVTMEICGGSDNDSLRGGGKSDKIYGGTAGGYEYGYDTLSGGSGNDLLTGSYAGQTTIWGGVGNDTLTASSGSSHLWGGDGNDSLVGRDGYDYLSGEDGNDTVYGAWGSDTLFGGNDQDLLQGGGMADTLWGGYGNDSLDGQGQIDDLNGGYGDDTLNGGDSQPDDLSGGEGTDTADYSNRSEALTITLDDIANDGAANEHDNVHSDVENVLGGSSVDHITGSAAANVLAGNGGKDVIHGGGGNDTVTGGWGGDFLYGDGGNDVVDGEFDDDNLYGGAGDDTISGGLGSDVLVSIGGGTHDALSGGDDDAGGFFLDSFWLDSDGTETHDATSLEASHGHVHRVGSFVNGASKELQGQDLADPGLYTVGSDFDWSAAWDSSNDRFDDNPLFFYGEPYVKDVKQGALGDCYFLAGLAAIARQDVDKIKQSVVDLGDDTYAVQFFDGSSKRFYRVDNELPAQGHWAGYFYTTGIAYAQTGYGGDLWVPIMEKAFALYSGGSYDDIDGGYADEPYDALGLSNWTKDVDDDNALQTVSDALAAGKAVSVNTSWSPGDFDSGDTIVLNHVYAVYSVSVANNTITVYNPWGTDTDGSWTQGADDGFITYTFDSFQDYTRDFYIANL
jgi:Ca2+-binding RTX toxin-like protein